MKKINEYKGIIIIVILILGFAFYWFQVRPAKIIKKCIEEYPNAFSNFNIGKRDKPLYDKCLIESGLIRN